MQADAVLLRLRPGGRREFDMGELRERARPALLGFVAAMAALAG